MKWFGLHEYSLGFHFELQYLSIAFQRHENLLLYQFQNFSASESNYRKNGIIKVATPPSTFRAKIEKNKRKIFRNASTSKQKWLGVTYSACSYSLTDATKRQKDSIFLVRYWWRNQGSRYQRYIFDLKWSFESELVVYCKILEWFVTEGQEIEEFDELVEVQSDKATVPITSRYSGKVVKLHYDLEDVALVGQPLVDLEVEDDGDAEPVDHYEQSKFLSTHFSRFYALLFRKRRAKSYKENSFKCCQRR